MPGVTTQISRRTSLPIAHPDRLPTRPQAPQAAPSYYDLSFLKPSVWKWEIANYFFLGGMSGGAYLIARLAERYGGREYRHITRVGTLLAFAALLPSPPLLIADLGDPKRFHHMLRVWKPRTPMNLGTWVLTSYSGPAALALLREWAKNRPRRDHGTLGQIARWVREANTPIVAVTDAAGMPLALLLAGYTGVLLSCTANPLWSKNPWLGPMFTSSGIASGAAGISAALTLMGHSPDEPSHQALSKVESAASVAELTCVAGFLVHAGPNAEPLTRGKYKHHLWAGVGGSILGEILNRLPLRGQARRTASLLSSIATMAAAWSLRWAMVYGGKEAAANPKLAQNISRPRIPAHEPPLLPPAGNVLGAPGSGTAGATRSIP